MNFFSLIATEGDPQEVVPLAVELRRRPSG
jgi:hypothetical protein